MKKFIFMAIALLMATACEPERDQKDSWSKSIADNMVTVNTVSGVEYTDNATVVVEIKDITKPYVNLTIEGVKFVPMMPDVNFTLSDVPFTIYASDDTNDPLYGSWTFNESSIVPSVGGVSREEYTMHNFKGNISDYGVVLEFDVNFGGVIYHAVFGKNQALQSWDADFKANATVVINPGESASTSTDELTVSFVQENLSKQIVDITFKDLRFVPQMPEVTITLKAVPFSYSEDGSQRLFNVATITPYVGEEEYKQFVLTSFTGSVSKSELILDCDIASMNAHASISGTSK